MATITNTVQGLNETVGLLKQILKVVNSSGKEEKGVDVKDVASSSNVLAEIGEKDPEKLKAIVSSLEPLDKMSKEIGSKAKNLADALKIMCSKEVIEGLKKYKNIPSKIGANIAGIFMSIGAAFDKIDKGLNIGRLNRFARTLNVLMKAINRGVNVMYKLAGFVVVCALVGVIAIFAWKQILIGFATIVAVALGVVAISMILRMVSRNARKSLDDVAVICIAIMMLSAIVVVSVLVGFIAMLAWPQILIGFATIIAVALGIVFLSYIIALTAEITDDNIISVAFVIAAILALALIVVVSALVGWLAQNAWPQILIGFATIFAIALGVVAICFLINGILKAGNLKLKDFFVNLIGKEYKVPDGVKNILLMALALTLIPITCVIVGWIAQKNFEYIAIGFGVIMTIMGSIAVLLRFVGRMGQQNIRVQFQVKQLVITILSIIGMVYAILKLAQMIDEAGIPIGNILLVVGIMGSMIVGFNFLIKAIGKIKLDKKGTLTLLAVIAMIGLVILMTNLIIDIAKKVQEVGGWGKIFIAVAAMATIIMGFMAFAMAIGALVSITVLGIPIVAILLQTGVVAVMAISGMAVLVGVAILTIAKAYKECNEAGIKIEEIGNIGTKMGGALTSFVKGIYNELKDLDLFVMLKIGIMMRPITKIVAVCSLFLKMVSSFSTEDCTPDEVRPVIFDEKRSTFIIGKKIHLLNAGTAIASGFSAFVKGIETGMENIKNRKMRKIARMMEPVEKIINTCSKFLKMISCFTTETNTITEDSTSALISPVYYNPDQGSFIVGEPIDVAKMGEVISGGFSAFVKGIQTGMENIKRRQMRKIGRMMEPVAAVINNCSRFLDMISGIAPEGENTLRKVTMVEKQDDKGNMTIEYVKGEPINIKSIGETISSAFGTFCSKVVEGLESIDRKEARKMKKLKKAGLYEITMACASFAEMIGSLDGGDDTTLHYYMLDNEGNYMKNSEGKYLVRKVNVSNVATSIASGFSTFVNLLAASMDGKDVTKKLSDIKNSGMDGILTTISNFVNIISSFSSTGGKLGVIMKDGSGNYMFDKSGKIKTRDVNLPLCGTLIKNAFEGFITNVTSMDAKGDFGSFAINFESVANSFKKIADSIFNSTEEIASRGKKSTDAINNFAKAIKNLTDALKGLSKTPTSFEFDVKNNKIVGNAGRGSTNPTNPTNPSGDGGGGGTSAETIKKGIEDALKGIIFEMKFEGAMGPKEGEILAIKRGKDLEGKIFDGSIRTTWG